MKWRTLFLSLFYCLALALTGCPMHHAVDFDPSSFLCTNGASRIALGPFQTNVLSGRFLLGDPETADPIAGGTVLLRSIGAAPPRRYELEVGIDGSFGPAKLATGVYRFETCLDGYSTLEGTITIEPTYPNTLVILATELAI